MSDDGLLLGIDEGTTGVKAALFDQRLQPVAEARRDKVNRHPEEGWVEQDGNEVLEVVTESIAELLAGTDQEMIACGLDHQGESVLGWDKETGEPLSPIVVWQDKRSQEILDELADSEEEVKELSGLPFDPYFSAAKLAWLLRHNDDVKKARDEGRLRMGTVDSFLCDRLGAGFATEPATASRTQLQRIDRPGFDERLCEIFGVPMDVLPEIRDTAGELGTLKHESWPVELPFRGQVVDQQAALAGAACVEPGRVKATYGTGVFVLGPRRRGCPEAGRGPAPDRRLEHRRQARVRPRRGRVRRRGDAGVDVQPARDRRGPAGAQQAGPRGRDLRRGQGAPRAGGDRGALVAAQCAGGDLGDLWRDDAGERRAGGAGGNRLAGGGRGRGDSRDRPGGRPAGGRRPHQRAAGAAAPGGFDRRAGRGRRSRCDRARGGRARRGGSRGDRLAHRPARRCSRRTAGWSRSGTRAGGRPSTTAGASSCARPRPSIRDRRIQPS